MSYEEVGGSIARRYRVLESIGHGGLGTVYKALDTRFNRVVAVKVLPLALDTASTDRLRVEADALAGLSHPNIVQVYDVGETQDFVYLAEEFIEGPTLAQLIADGKPLDWFYAVEIIRQVGTALAHAHKHGVIHRDVKPTNIIISNDGRVLLLDFGLAISPGAPTLTGVGKVMGTAAYMSPEQVLGNPVDARSDVFSLGIVFYELLTGRRPFSAASVAESLRNVIENEPFPLGDINPSVPTAINEIVLKSLVKNPDQRFQNVDELLSLLAVVEPSRSPESIFTPKPNDSDFGALVAFPDQLDPDLREKFRSTSSLPLSVGDSLSVSPSSRGLNWRWFAGVLVVVLLGTLAFVFHSFGTAVFALVCGVLIFWSLSHPIQQKDGLIAPAPPSSPPVLRSVPPRSNRQDEADSEITATELTPYAPALAPEPQTLTIARELFDRYKQLAVQAEESNEVPIETRRKLEEFEALWDQLMSSARHD